MSETPDCLKTDANRWLLRRLGFEQLAALLTEDERTRLIRLVPVMPALNGRPMMIALAGPLAGVPVAVSTTARRLRLVAKPAGTGAPDRPRPWFIGQQLVIEHRLIAATLGPVNLPHAQGLVEAQWLVLRRGSYLPGPKLIEATECFRPLGYKVRWNIVVEKPARIWRIGTPGSSELATLPCLAPSPAGRRLKTTRHGRA